MSRSWLEAVTEVAERTAQTALTSFRKPLAVEQKADGTPVTQADRAAEEVARQWISSHFPDDGIFGEELGVLRPEARRRWFVDPIDGTKSFVRGVPLWGTLVGVMEGDDVLAGAIVCPALGEQVVAARGEGCYWNGSRCAVSTVSVLEEATVLTTDTRTLPPALAALFRTGAVGRTWGDCYGYLLVATGRAEVMMDPVLSPWDSVALQPVIEEAGGVFTDLSGQRTALGGSALATNATLAQHVRERTNSVPSFDPRTDLPALSDEAKRQGFARSAAERTHTYVSSASQQTLAFCPSHEAGRSVLNRLDFQKQGGIITVVAQDAQSGRVLMVAQANREAIDRTLATGEMHYTSRTRGLWHKGGTSGHVQRVLTLAADCDGDTLLARVHSEGPACHTGTVSCFGETMAAGADHAP